MKNKNLYFLLALFLALVFFLFGVTSNASAQSCPSCNINPLPAIGNLDCDYDDSGVTNCTYTIPYPYSGQYPNRYDERGAYRHDIQVYDTSDWSTYLKKIWGQGNNNLTLELTRDEIDNACKNHPGETLTLAFTYILRYDRSCDVTTYYAPTPSLSFCGNFACTDLPPDEAWECKNNCCEIPSIYTDSVNNISLPAGLEVQRECGVPPTCNDPVPDPMQSFYAPGTTITVNGSGSSSGVGTSYTWRATAGSIETTDDESIIKYTFPDGITGISPAIKFQISDSLGTSQWCSVILDTYACGNGVVEADEMCETNSDCLPGEACLACDCIASGLCGNGEIDPGEECDDGNLASSDGCSSDCEKEYLKCNNNLNLCEYSASVNGNQDSCASVGEACNIPESNGIIEVRTVLCEGFDTCDEPHNLDGVIVYLTATSTSQITTVRSDSSGQALFQDLVYGEYTLDGEKSGYMNIDDFQSVTLSDSNPSQSVVLHFYKLDEVPFITINQGNFTLLNEYVTRMAPDSVAIMYDGSLLANGEINFGDGSLGPLDPDTNSVYSYSNYNSSPMPLDDLFEWIRSVGDTDYIEYERPISAYVIDENFELEGDKIVLMVDGDLEIKENVETIRALIVVSGNVTIESVQDDDVTVSSTPPLEIDGGLWVNGYVLNSRVNGVTVLSNLEYLDRSVFEGFWPKTTKAYWLRLD